MKVEEFRELAQEPVELTIRYVVQIRSDRLWLASFVMPTGSSSPSSRWSRAFERPPGKTLELCQEAALRALASACARGELPLE